MPMVIGVFYVLLVFFNLSGNLYSSDLSATIGPDRLAETILDQAPPQAVVVVNEDNALLPLWYHCYALQKRSDLALISAGALYRPAYREHLRHVYPDLAYPKEFDVYKITDIKAAIEAFCKANADDRPFMIQFGVPGIEAASLIPAGVLFRYAHTDNDRSIDPVYPSVAMLDDIAGRATDLLTKDFIARLAFNYGVYADRMGKREAALEFFQYAIETDDQNPDYLLRLGLAFLNAGRRNEAILLLEEAAVTGPGCPEAETILKKLADEEFGQR
jgi:tetratricopeptide (TPR) repeat protein